MQPKKQQDNTNTNTQSQQMRNSQQQSQQKLNYTIDRIIGNGTFGRVYLATLTDTNEQVAIKKVFQDKRYKNRELQIIKELSHINLVNLKQAFYSQGDKPEEVYLNLVMEYVTETLSKMIRYHRKSKQPYPQNLLKIYAYQMFRGLAYLEGTGICHRDIKPQNILVDNDRALLKICDFGSAKRLIKGEPNVAYICSRYYRAPELIFGATEYTNAIDIWSMGCCIAEMVLGEPIFPGESAVDQLVEIIKILGTPTIDQIKQMNPAHTEFKFPQIKAHPWNKVFSKHKVDPYLIDMISKCLVYSPIIRPKALEVLTHPYFNDVRSQSYLAQFNSHPELFNFYQEEISTNPQLIPQLTPEWYKK